MSLPTMTVRPVHPEDMPLPGSRAARECIGWVESVDADGVATVSLHRESECIATTGYEVVDVPQLEPHVP